MGARIRDGAWPRRRQRLRLAGSAAAAVILLLSALSADAALQQPLVTPQAEIVATAQAEIAATAQAEIAAAEERIDVGQLPTESDILALGDLQGVPISINFVDTDIRDVARFFSNLTGLNVVVDPEVSGPVTVSFFDVAWDTAFQAILRSHQLGFSIDENIVRVSSLGRLADEAEDRARLANQAELASPLNTHTTRLSYATAANLVPIIEPQLSQRGEVMVDVRTNTLILKDTADSLDAILGLVTTLDVAAPQVLIESRIVETTKEFGRELGIQWGFSGVADAQHGNTTGLVFPNNIGIQGLNNPLSATQQLGAGGVPFAVNLPSQNATSGVALTMGNILDTFRLDVALSAMEEEGRGKIISSPKVTAQDNIRASIESGRRIPVQTLIDNTASITFINANLQLEVTPQITSEQTIMLDIVVDKSEPDFGNAVLGIPTIFTRRAETKLLVRDGGTTVIGGIFQMTATEQESRVPFFHRIPLLGSLFKSRKTEQTNNELLIFITPRILEQ